MGNKYLGKVVEDIGKKGLSHAVEFYNIERAIVEDYKKKKIDKKTALGRLLLLYRLTYKKNNSNLRIKRETAKRIRDEIKLFMIAIKRGLI